MTRRLSAAVATSATRRIAEFRPAASALGEPPEAARLRAVLLSGDRNAAENAALELLELLEPPSLAEAHGLAFEGGGPPSARQALRAAWEIYRYDRHRGIN